MVNAAHDIPLPGWLEGFRRQLAERHSAAVDVLETHISWLLLVDGLAYKLKKPLVLPFLDYGTPARRQAFCAAELRLNRRFAPDLYLDVVPAGDSGEWAVRMRRFDEAMRLDHLCAAGGLTQAHLTGLARTLARVQRAAPVAAADTPFGTPEKILAPALDNFRDLARLLPTEQPRLHALEAWTRAEFARRAADFAARKAAGRVREGHGDLHLGNLVLIDGAVLPFDCIEFNDDFRWIDVASELAFTWIDLLDHGRPDLAAGLLDAWLAESGDVEAVPVLRFYAVYRALVRAKVAALRGALGAGEVAGEQTEAQTEKQAMEEASGYVALAERLVRPARRGLTITFGPAASGKSTASRALLLADPEAATLRLRSDVERKRLHGLDARAASHSGVTSGLYDASASDRTYARLGEVAGCWLAAGWSVVIDAACLERARRDAFRALAERQGAAFAILACAASPAELAQRLAARRGDVSEATLPVLRHQLATIEPLGADEQVFVLPAAMG